MSAMSTGTLPSACQSSWQGPSGGLPCRSRPPPKSHSRPCSIHLPQNYHLPRQLTAIKHCLRLRSAASAGEVATCVATAQLEPATLKHDAAAPALSVESNASAQLNVDEGPPPSSSTRMQIGEASSATTSSSSTTSTTSSSSSSGKDPSAAELARRQSISKANTGRVPWNKGRKHSPETIAKIRARSMEALQRPEVQAKLQAHKESLAGRKLSDNHKESIRDGMMATHTEERAAVKSEVMKKKWQDPEYREKTLAKLNSAEVMAKRAETRRSRQATTTTTTSSSSSELSDSSNSSTAVTTMSDSSSGSSRPSRARRQASGNSEAGSPEATTSSSSTSSAAPKIRSRSKKVEAADAEDAPSEVKSRTRRSNKAAEGKQEEGGPSTRGRGSSRSSSSSEETGWAPPIIGSGKQSRAVSMPSTSKEKVRRVRSQDAVQRKTGAKRSTSKDYDMLRQNLQDIVTKTRGLKELIARTEGLLSKLEASSQAIINDPVACKKLESGKEMAQEKVRIAREQVREHTAILEQHGVVWDEDTGVIVEVRNWQAQVQVEDSPAAGGDEDDEEEEQDDGGGGGGDVQESQQISGSNGGGTHWHSEPASSSGGRGGGSGRGRSTAAKSMAMAG